MGGAVSAIENGYMANEISRSSYEYQKEIESNKKIVVGVNKFEDQIEIEPNLLEIDPLRVKSQMGQKDLMHLYHGLLWMMGLYYRE